jgi:hypothetical protein
MSEKEEKDKSAAEPAAVSKKMIRWFERSFKGVFPNTDFIPLHDGGKAIEVVYLKNAEATAEAIGAFREIFSAVTGLKADRLVFIELDRTLNTPRAAPEQQALDAERRSVE